MAAPRKTFVVGYVPRVTRPSGFYFPVGRNAEDVLKAFLVALAPADPDKDSLRLAQTYPEEYLDVLLRGHGGVIFMVIDGDTTMYCTRQRPYVPPKIVELLARAGVRANTPMSWVKDAYTGEPESDYADKCVLGLPKTQAPASPVSDIATKPPTAAEFDAYDLAADPIVTAKSRKNAAAAAATSPASESVATKIVDDLINS